MATAVSRTLYIRLDPGRLLIGRHPIRQVSGLILRYHRHIRPKENQHTPHPSMHNLPGKRPEPTSWRSVVALQDAAAERSFAVAEPASFYGQGRAVG